MPPDYGTRFYAASFFIFKSSQIFLCFSQQGIDFSHGEGEELSADLVQFFKRGFEARQKLFYKPAFFFTCGRMQSDAPPKCASFCASLSSLTGAVQPAVRF